jgi:hypothetical protein
MFGMKKAKDLEKTGNIQNDDSIELVIEGKPYSLTPGELAQTNSLLLEALIGELTKKKLIDPIELGKTLEKIQSERLKKK